jgi:hypothetical protein
LILLVVFVTAAPFNALKSTADVITTANEKAKITQLDLLWIFSHIIITSIPF